MSNWKENIISRVKKEKLEKEIKDMVVDFKKDKEKINQEFDELCKEIEDLDYDSSIHMNKISGNGECLRKFTVLGVEYSLLVETSQISIIAVKGESESYQIYRVLGGSGENKYAQYLRKEDIKQLNKQDKINNELDTTDFDYNKILDTLMDRAYEEINQKMQQEELDRMCQKLKESGIINNSEVEKAKDIWEDLEQKIKKGLDHFQ